MSKLEDSREKLLRIPVRKTRLFFLVGYILRALSITNIVGLVLTGIGWGILSRRPGGLGYVLATIACIAAFAMHLYSIFAESPISAVNIPAITENAALIDVKQAMLSVIDATQKTLLNPISSIIPVIGGLALLLETGGVVKLKKDTDGLIPGYFVVLFIVLGLLLVAQGAFYPFVAGNLDSVKQAVEQAKSIPEVQSAVFSLMVALAPVVILSSIGFILGLATYILFGYKYWSLWKRVKRLEVAREDRKEALI
ncbi:MAG: hypothetical protein DRO13_01335 [Thermoprotei archaeon]|nr:MAG: hypothetical protein DRO13_01335 [Thermoprotei archaeon]